ncbi:MAG: Glycosyl transferase family 39 [candidate division WWE3 bacterium GW2011_GWA1_46_21]|uniref:Glycosyl transferase family 39 n=4 Tax=Katanobacteria TaxID=422282 RepID=A0A0G1SBX2_UNCKA|nr:MAG: Glycosyl transferase family 39 [candidate division WWE3 bacterium GW2011_GWA1_46_21]KKU51027.1 MAG: Glycosyl transferase family 39 [candidate division WWE3 bacterium GW2011_GWC1_47_10]KKU58006.1 MAG: Glycosyl transferase family 39 [candidate division WWE3 bacterium GW2011_GWB1_47_11]
MPIELIVLVSLFIISALLILHNEKVAFGVLLVLSGLLHKELFSIYNWDLLPVRLLMAAFVFVAGVKVIPWFLRKSDRKILSDPFILLFTLLWFVRGASLAFSKNPEHSVLLFGFFTTVYVLGIYLYTHLLADQQITFVYIRFYIFIAFGLCVLAIAQFLIYQFSGVIFGALWNVPGHLPRVGSTFWDVNHFGSLLAALLPVLGVLILVAPRLRDKTMYLAMFLPMTGILALTNSRSAWMLAGIAFISFITILLVRKFSVKGVLYVVAAVILVSLPILREYSIKSSPFRAAVRQYFNYRLDSFDSHFLLIKGAFEVFEEFPVLGGGYGGFFERFSKTGTAAEYFGRDPAGLNVRVPAHTIWGEAVAETGGMGISVLLLFSALVAGVLLFAALSAPDRTDYMLAAAMASAILGWYVAGIFYSYNSEFFWLILFLYFIYGVRVVGQTNYLQKVVDYFVASGKTPVIFIGLLAGFLLFVNLGANHLIPWDEAIYAQVSKNMLLKGDLLAQQWVPEAMWFEKPPLYLWLVVAAMRVFGITELAARLPSAVFGFSTILLIYFFGKKLFGKTAGFLAALSLLTTFQYLYYARSAMLDVTMTFFLTLGLYFYVLALQTNNRRYWILSGLSGGFAVMTKSIVGFLGLPVIFINEFLLTFLGDVKIAKVRFTNYLYLLGAYSAVFLPWHAEMVRRYGSTFLKEYLGYHILTRATSGIEDKAKPLYWYFVVLKVSMRLWFVALLGAFPYSLFFAFVRRNRNYIFLLIWGLFMFLFFSVSKSKIVWYMIPVYPALSLIIGAAGSGLLHRFVYRINVGNKKLMKSLILYAVIMVSLVYFYVKRELVFVPDLTGPQAVLLQAKDKEFGKEVVVFADRIDRPLDVFYTEGPYETVDFSSLAEKMKYPKYTDRIIFITKESRFKSLSVTNPTMKLSLKEKEWVLGYKPSTHEVDLEKLKTVQTLVQRTQSNIDESVRKGYGIPAELILDLEQRKQEEALIKAQIVVGLESASSNQ